MTQTTWFITGIGRGLGRALAEQALARGDRVAGTYRRAAGLDAWQQRYGDRFWSAPLDVTDAASIDAVVNRAFADLGRIDVIVNNAGYGVVGAVEELSDAQIRHQLDTNLLGSIRVARAVIPHLRQQGGGRLIQLSTMGGQVAFPAASLYHASKWGIEGFIDAVRHELAPFNIGVTLVEPGSTATDFGKNLIVADTLPAYETGPVGNIRQFFGSGDYQAPGDVDKTAAAIIASADQNPAPLRLATGSDAYHAIRQALQSRLADLEAQQAVAFSTDR